MSQLRISDKPVRNKVFISYSHQDKKWFDLVLTHLKPLEREGRINVWKDTQIKGGERWYEEIKKAIEVTKVAILLVSPHFYASDFIAKDELPPLLDAAEKDGAIILTVNVRPSFFVNDSKLNQYQAINSVERSLNKISQSNQDKTLLALSQRLMEILT